MSKPSLPQGTRDFSAETIRKRNYIFQNIKHVFELYGFQPLETPAMENLETLMGKYGEEGDRLIFKILNNGLNDPKNSLKAQEGFEKVIQGKNSTLLTERALKYDLTIPFARYVAMNHGTLVFPFKRYQIQPVWRADRPQKGRYREFTQCDVDVVGSQSLLNEVELINIYHDVFTRLGLKGYALKVNNRKILSALANYCGGIELLTDITVAIDKLDKIGVEKVLAELSQRGLKEEQIKIISNYLEINGTNSAKLRAVEQLLGEQAEAKEGIHELQFLLNNAGSVNIEIDFTLARGLNYYTGMIVEAKAPKNVQMGSIGGGGRYDNLTSLFGVPNIPGVGISFGVDRIFDVLEELDLFPGDLHQTTKALFFNMGESEAIHALSLMQSLRQRNISCELYHEAAKLDKQFKYAEKKKIQYAVIVGSKEIAAQECIVKNLKTGNQETLMANELYKKLQ
jgi:histidyl-tRNA synthetase